MPATKSEGRTDGGSPSARTAAEEAVRSAVSFHPRRYEDNRYVYPVLSRRSKGVSIGVNLNPDKVCNFDCIYCQVDRTVAPTFRTVDLDVLAEELRTLLTMIQDGSLFERVPFQDIPDALKRVNDIAFSGDGEPTSYPGFGEAVKRAVTVRDSFNLEEVKIVVITNATLFHRPKVRAAMDYLDLHNGEVWAKLDAGTEAYYQVIERTKVSFERIVSNIKDAARRRPLVIQSLFMKVAGVPPSTDEIAAYCGVLQDVLASQGTLKLIQVYTVARTPAESFVSPLSDEDMDALGACIRHAVGAPLEVYYGVTQ